jgi:hypothetical protein
MAHHGNGSIRSGFQKVLRIGSIRRKYGQEKIPIGTWAFIRDGDKEDPIAFEIVLDTLRKLGFDEIEFGAFEPHLESWTAPSFPPRTRPTCRPS